VLIIQTEYKIKAKFMVDFGSNTIYTQTELVLEESIKKYMPIVKKVREE